MHSTKEAEVLLPIARHALLMEDTSHTSPAGKKEASKQAVTKASFIGFSQ